jgi:serine/threonine protein kinase
MESVEVALDTVGARRLPLAKANELFPRRGDLGHGAHGCVLRALDAVRGVEVAVKLVNVSSPLAARAAAQEIVALTRLRGSAHIVALREVVFCDPFVQLMLEVAPKNLAVTIGGRPLSRRATVRYTLGLFRGLAACHAACIVHCDIKPANVLIGADDEVQIADFGLARDLDGTVEAGAHYLGTLHYRAPELLLGSDILAPAVDVWSAGCVVMEMCMGRAPVRGETPIDQILRVFKLLGTPSTREWSDVDLYPGWSSLFPTWPPDPHAYDTADAQGLENVARRCFVVSPTQRSSAEELAKLLN